MRSPPILPLSLLAALALGLPAGAETLSRAQIIAQGEKVADAQLALLSGKKAEIGWVSAVMWAGYSDFSHVSANPAHAAAVEKMGDDFWWTPRFNPKLPVNADDLCICQTFLDAFAVKNDQARLGPTAQRLDAEIDHINSGELPDIPGSGKTNLTWWWCDALFMAPASLARLTAITQNPAYLNAMDKEWWKTSDLLYDKDEHLFSRDITYLSKKTKDGKKVFWSRGNGWVFAGLARTLTYIAATYPSRPRYVEQYKAMAAKLASLQQPDGAWRPSLLDPEEFPDSEMSGTALDCFAFAWGINNGILDRATYIGVAEKAWAGLLASRRADGVPGYVQQVGGGPAAVSATGTQLYATGAFLMAAGQLASLAPIDIPPPPQLTAAPAPPAATPARSGTFSKISDTVVDPAALTLAPHATYGSAINGEPFQQDIIHTSAGWQYVAYYDQARHVCVARRHLPGDPWQVVRLADYDFKGNDAHNTVSLGICETDGAIHLAFDHHVNPLHYRVSKPGAATHPESISWDASLFGPVHSDLEAGKPIKVTYPRFWNTPDGGLQFHYRNGSSGNCNNMLVYNQPYPGEPFEHGIYFDRGRLVIASASAASIWSDWHVVTQEQGPFINEMIADPTRWKTDKVLSVIAQETAKVIGEPSALHVIDYRQTP